MMKKLFIGLIALLLIGTFFHSCNEPLVNEPTDDGLELKSADLTKKSYIVVLNDAELDAELSSLKGYEKRKAAASKAASKVLKRAAVQGQIGHAYGTAIKGFSVKIPPGQLKKLENDPSVKYVEEDRVISLDQPDVRIKKRPVPEPPEPPAESIPWGITRVNGGGANLASGSPKAWIVDSGIDMDHPDLNVNISLSRDFTGSGTPEDAHGHGTHVAGTVAAINNDIGVVGVAPNAEVISCRVLGADGSGAFSWTIAALDYIAGVANAGDVVNMSLGPSVRYTDQAVDDAVAGAAAAAEVKIAIAAGNESDDAIYYSPARTDALNVYTISAMDSDDEFAYFSNYGSPVDYCDPGVNIYSTYKGASYATMSGTSMAAPHAAGLLLLGNTTTDGYVIGDPDGNADPILVYDDEGTNPPVNQAPNADFTFDVNDLSVQFTDASSDDNGVVSWVWDFGDGATSSVSSPSHTYSSYGTKTVSLTVEDAEGETATASKQITLIEEPVGGDISIAAVGSKVRGTRYIEVTWSGATGSNVDIKLNGTTQETTVNDGSHTLDMGRISGTFVVTVCETDGSVCSSGVTVTI